MSKTENITELLEESTFTNNDFLKKCLSTKKEKEREKREKRWTKISKEEKNVLLCIEYNTFNHATLQTKIIIF